MSPIAGSYDIISTNYWSFLDLLRKRMVSGKNVKRKMLSFITNERKPLHNDFASGPKLLKYICDIKS